MITLLIAQAIIAASPTKNGATPLASAGPVVVDGAYRAVETWGKTDYTGQVNDGLTVVNARRDGIRLKGKVDRVTIRNFSLTHHPIGNVGSDLPTGVGVDNGSDITIENGFIAGFKMQYVPGAYWNGDGVRTERDATRIDIRRVTVLDSSDGCYDLKSTATRLIDVTGVLCGYTLREWGETEATTLISVQPRKGHVALYTGAKLHIRHLVVTSSEPVPIFVTEKLTAAASLIVDRCTRNVPTKTPLFLGKRPATLVLGLGCE